MFETQLSAWAESALSFNASDELECAAVDGKTLRGSQKQGAPAAHLLSAVSHRLGLTLAQRAVPDDRNEIPAALELLRGLILEGRVITTDALLTQRKLAQAIVDARGHYLMVVKENQSGLKDWIRSVIDDPVWLREAPGQAEAVDCGHGRVEHRKLTVSATLSGSDLWPGLRQVFKIERTVIEKSSGETTQEVVYGCTSLEQTKATAATLLKVARGHWAIENKSHRVRDVTFDEDRSQVRRGSLPQVMAALRNTAIGLMRSAGEGNIAAAYRRYAAQPSSALALIGIKPEN